MKVKNIVLIICCCFLIGIIGTGFLSGWFIIRTPFNTQYLHTEATNPIERKKISLFYLRQGKWFSETQEILWPQEPEKKAYYLINALLHILDEEEITLKSVHLNTACFTDQDATLFLSFDRSPFNKSDSTIKKLQWAESILKTVQNNKLSIQSIMFLVHHQPINDYHLDFSKPWPINGYSNTSNP